MPKKPEQVHFEQSVAPRLVRSLPGHLVEESHKSALYCYFGDAGRFVVVVGAHEKQVDWALVYGLAESKGRQLILVLPEGGAFATRQRVPWLTAGNRPHVWMHNGRRAWEAPAFSTEQTIEALSDWAKEKTDGKGVTFELVQASTPLHLGKRSGLVAELAEWATNLPQLDAAHRRSQRSWHCMGQRVLSFETGESGIRVRAGIHDKLGSHSMAVTLSDGDELAGRQFEALKRATLRGIETRLHPAGPYPADEHWLQAVIRRDPSLVGVESPALREVPAWRPAGGQGTFSRGYLDLLGLDGHGDIRIVEAKIAKSSDEMTLLQGIDYRVWAEAYKRPLMQKLSAPKQAALRLHYVVGQMDGVTKLLPPRVAKYAPFVDTEACPFTFHTIWGWQSWTPSARPSLKSHPSTDNQIPSWPPRV
jgi:hypothetical protein